MSAVLAACDLDGTLIYSESVRNGLGSDSGFICVEFRRGQPWSYVSAGAAAEMAELAGSLLLVPATTRTREQYARLRLPGPPPSYAICANGGHLLVDGVTDDDWHREVRRRLGATTAPLPEILAHIRDETSRTSTVTVRTVEGMFGYIIARDRRSFPREWLTELAEWAEGLGWRLSASGSKIHVVPCGLTKSAAVAEVARRTSARRVLAAGDSLLDADMLRLAEHGIHPAHGELAASGWSHPSVVMTHSAGAAAGDEILRWLRRMAAL
jgi:hypothetical protein